MLKPNEYLDLCFLSVTKPVAVGGKEVQWIILQVNCLHLLQRFNTEHVRGGHDPDLKKCFLQPIWS